MGRGVSPNQDDAAQTTQEAAEGIPRSRMSMKKLDLKSNCGPTTALNSTTRQPLLVVPILGMSQKPNTTTTSIWFQSLRRHHKYVTLHHGSISGSM